VWSDASWKLEEALNAAHLYKSFPFFVTAVGVDDKNSSSYFITVCPHVLHVMLCHCMELAWSLLSALSTSFPEHKSNINY